eukprot:gnl/TRDRNA2_/TRDRNA2_180371_c0_seq1.p1 gnl/TRDRNA2_/TRDRNA2_180371_c0~~gnl/TRDRNA2_/TRDRNA2_180371_c0_seq1.p1  ORF type:complete len:430 (-),score=107.82 gnl/TRDRNA2_/TRDRNA2_180371_c0_seq1:176-1465(-)
MAFNPPARGRRGIISDDFDGSEYGEEYMVVKANDIVILQRVDDDDDGWAFGVRVKDKKEGWFPTGFWSEAPEPEPKPEPAAAKPAAAASQKEVIWEVIGGAERGGVVVRAGQDTDSKQESERLSTGALVKQLELVGERLHYELLYGFGPRTGWVSIRLQNGKDLLVITTKRVPAATSDDSSKKDSPFSKTMLDAVVSAASPYKDGPEKKASRSSDKFRADSTGNQFALKVADEELADWLNFKNVKEEEPAQPEDKLANLKEKMPKKVLDTLLKMYKPEEAMGIMNIKAEYEVSRILGVDPSIVRAFGKMEEAIKFLRHEEARSRLKRGVSERSISDLKWAIMYAKDAYLDPEELEGFQFILEDLENEAKPPPMALRNCSESEATDACEAITLAAMAKDTAALKAAIAHAKNIGVPKKEIARANAIASDM